MDRPNIFEAPSGHVLKTVRPDPTGSPPPNCPICLGAYTNRCYTDSCLHQFCFSCLLRWSKRKATCPLCIQPFTSILHNIKSNSEYEEYAIANPERDISEEELILETEEAQNDYLFLPNGSRPQRHFQFRTTLTVNPGGELAIQQLLLAHPLTNSIILPSGRHFRVPSPPSQSIQYRRYIYNNDQWAYSPPDNSLTYRECSPMFFRENPAATHRVVPWLNRELSALMIDYLDIYCLQDMILELLCQYDVRSSTFHTRIYGYLGPRTDHFIHEFYNFLRSPFDMVGYDRHVEYRPRRSHIPLFGFNEQISDEDSDVRVVDSPNDCIYVPPRTPEVIVINSDSDSDVMIREPTPPPIVDLLDTDTDEENPNVVDSNEPEDRKSPQLPIKLRLKKSNITRIKMKNRGRKSPSTDSNYSTQSASASGSSDYKTDEEDLPYSYDCVSIKSESKYPQPLVIKRVKSKHKSTKMRRHKHSKKKSSRWYSDDEESEACDSNSSYKHRKLSKRNLKPKKCKRKSNGGDDYRRKKKYKRSKEESVTRYKISKFSSSEDSDYETNKKPSSPENLDDTCEDKVQTNIQDSPSQNLDVAGPSTISNMPSVIVSAGKKWYNRPDLDYPSDVSD